MKKMYLMLIIFVCLSCYSSKKETIREIDISDVFNMKENKYIVLFYSSTCKACEFALEILNKRYQNKKYQGFCVNIDDKELTFATEKVTNINKNNIEELLIYSVPYLIFINLNCVVEELYGCTNIQKENLYIFFE